MRGTGRPGMTDTKRHRATAAVIVLASTVTVTAMSVAVARNDAGVHEFFLRGADVAPDRSSSAAPPLTVRVAHGPSRMRAAGRNVAAAPRAMPPARRVAGGASIPLPAPRPDRPAVVSMFEDRTLRRGDAVMTLAGLRVFAGSRSWPFRPRDFTALDDSKILSFRLRGALAELTRSPYRAVRMASNGLRRVR